MIKKIFNELTMCARFVLGLKGFVQEKMTFEDAMAAVKKRLEHREENFLKVIKKGIFEYEKSPYLPLFKSAHYEYGDVEKLVSERGIEETLKILKQDGVYFTIQEFKGREREFDNPYTAACYETRSGATRGAGTRVELDFDYFSQVSANRGSMLDVWGLRDHPVIILRPAIPFGSGMKIMLSLSKFGVYPRRYISPIESKNISFKNRLGMFYIIKMGNLFGAKFLKPEFIGYDNIDKIVDIIDDLNKEHKKCMVAANVSAAVRVCLAAKKIGVSFKGVIFKGAGEPFTAERQKAIEDSGARYIIEYAFSEAGGPVGCLCLKASVVDDIHLFKDSIALISYKKEVMGLLLDAFLVTSLLPSAPKILLNVENGDHGIIEERECGCPYGELGYNIHICNIRSFEKFTGEGMTFYGAGFIRIIERVLCAKFGGNPLQYQITEEADENGMVQLAILADPVIGPIDEGELIRTILSELSKGDDSQKMMTDVWARLGAMKVKRLPPLLTGAGKYYPLYINPGRQK